MKTTILSVPFMHDFGSLPRVMRVAGMLGMVCLSMSFLNVCGDLGHTSAVAQDARDRDRDPSGGGGVPNAANGPGDARLLLPGTPQLGPGQAPIHRLGILSRNTNTGVEILQISPNSVAQRAGLEAGDVIVTVAGYQVGMVGERLFDIGDELAKRVDRRGRVTLLVRNRRDGALYNIPCVFPVAMHLITGRITAADNRPLLANNTLTIRVVDITRPNWNDSVIAEQSLSGPRFWPIDYRLEIDPDRIQPGRRYGIVTRVFQQGLVVLDSGTPTPLSFGEAGDRVNMSLRRLPLPQSPLSPVEQIQLWYQQLLGRPPTPRELNAWQADLSRGRSLQDVQTTIMGGSEYYERNQSNDDRFIDEAYRQLGNTQNPPPALHAELKKQLDQQNGVRLKFLQDLQKQMQKK